MPTYEYRCPKGHEFELFQKMSDPPRAECPECGADSERVLSGGAGFLFRGEGFYVTDYRSEEYRKRAEAEKGGKGEQKPAGKGGEGGDTAAPAPGESAPSTPGGGASGAGRDSSAGGESGGTP